MGLWDIFKSEKTISDNSNYPTIYKKLTTMLPDYSEEKLLEVACISGLMAHVAFSDMNLDEAEIKKMEDNLYKWLEVDQKIASTIVKIATSEVNDLVSRENSLYTKTLYNMLDEQKKYHLLLALFSVAGADGKIESVEVGQIKVISQGLGLEHKFFVSAQMKFKDKISALK